MSLLFDSLWRAVAYCLHPRVIALSLVPLGVMIALAVGLVAAGLVAALSTPAADPGAAAPDLGLADLPGDEFRCAVGARQRRGAPARFPRAPAPPARDGHCHRLPGRRAQRGVGVRR